jgi:hypothetical protein
MARFTAPSLWLPGFDPEPVGATEPLASCLETQAPCVRCERGCHWLRHVECQPATLHAERSRLLRYTG